MVTTKQKTILLTGAGRGVGKLMAEVFAAAGWNVVAADLVAESVNALAEKITKNGHSAMPIAVDVSSDKSVATMVSKITERFPSIDVLVCAAGSYGKSFRATHETPEEEWDTVIGSNMKGPFLCAKYVIPVMLRNGGGRIINFASNAGRTTSPVLGCSYTAAKTGVIGVTRHLAKEYARRGIVVNTIAPGPMDGDRVNDQLQNPADKEALVNSIPVGRLGQEREICDVVMFLADRAPMYMTGAIVDVNGGYVLA